MIFVIRVVPEQPLLDQDISEFLFKVLQGYLTGYMNLKRTRCRVRAIALAFYLIMIISRFYLDLLLEGTLGKENQQGSQFRPPTPRLKA